MPYSPDQPQSPEQEKQQQPPQDQEQADNTLWPASAGEPSDDPDVLLLFHGLMGFARNDNFAGVGQRVCEIGVLTEASDHEFMVVVFESTPTQSGNRDLNFVYGFAPERPADVLGRKITIDVHRPAISGVSFFQPQVSGPRDPRDWKHVPDLEGPDFYDRELVKRPKAMKLRLVVKHGLFFTAWPTDREFERVDEDHSNGPKPDGHEIGPVAFVAAAELSHREGGHVSLQLGRDKTLVLRATCGRKYYICVLNACPSGDCKFKPDSPVKERRNDFHQYRKTFKLKDDESEYGLLLKPEHGTAAKTAGPTAMVALVQSLFALEPLAELLSTHEAPCGATGYGKTDDGLPGGG